MKPSASSWADEVEENSRGRLLSPLEHATPAVPGEPVIHSTPSANREPAIHATPAVAREPAIHPISAPTIPGGSHRVRELVRDIKGLKLGAAGNNNNFQKRWEEAKKKGNLFLCFSQVSHDSFSFPEHRENERERARLEMERMTLLQHTTAGALDRLGKSLCRAQTNTC